MDLFTGKEYLKIDVMNNMGYDKIPYQERLEKFDELIGVWVNKNTSEGQLWMLAAETENPAMVFGGLIAYRDCLAGKPSGYRCSLDSVNSGIQLMSALTRCESGLDMTGLISDRRADLYTEVYNDYKMLRADALDVKRDDIKYAIMTSVYGSKRVPLNLFGEEGFETFSMIMQHKCEGAWTLREMLINSWNPETTEHRWVMPDGFTVVCPVEVEKTYQINLYDEVIKVQIKELGKKPMGVSNCPNLIHAHDGFILREIIRRTNYDKAQAQFVYNFLIQLGEDEPYTPNANLKLANMVHLYEESKFLSIKVMDYIHSKADALALSKDHREHLLATLVQMLKQGTFEMLTVHDSFSFPANKGNFVRYWYNELLANTVDSNVLQFYIDQLDIDFTVPEQREERKILADKVRNSNYGLS